ncbi:MAG: hypothetical protein V7K53_24625 [Nostoc sp.]|uniref:hypothetical protein n=1 Tax=Nostoc sp. TaxID=1180 RepID=UPI002FFA6A3A
MESLAYIHLALAYEELETVDAVILFPKLNLFRLLNKQKFMYKAWIHSLCFYLTLMLLGVFNSSLALEIEKPKYRACHSESHPIAKTKPIQHVEKNLITSNSLSKTNLKNLKGEYRKLLLVNDSPDIALIFLYRPGYSQPYRYAYLSPYQEVKLRATYSNLWKISFNSQKRFFIEQVYEISTKDVFEIRASNLKEIEGPKISYVSQVKATDVQDEIDDIWKWFRLVSREVSNFQETGISYKKLAMEIAEVGEDVVKQFQKWTGELKKARKSADSIDENLEKFRDALIVKLKLQPDIKDIELRQISYELTNNNSEVINGFKECIPKVPILEIVNSLNLYFQAINKWDSVRLGNQSGPFSEKTNSGKVIRNLPTLIICK